MIVEDNILSIKAHPPGPQVGRIEYGKHYNPSVVFIASSLAPLPFGVPADFQDQPRQMSNIFGSRKLSSTFRVILLLLNIKGPYSSLELDLFTPRR